METVALSDQPISFADLDVQSCPFSAYDRLRKEQAVYRDPVTGNYVLISYADVRKVTLNTKLFSNSPNRPDGTANSAETKAAVAKIYDERGWHHADTMTSADAPGHRLYRTLVDKVFTTARITALEPRINEIAHELLDRLIDQPEVEFVSGFAIPLPIIVIAEQLGVPHEDMDRFKFWSDVAVASLSPQTTAQAAIKAAYDMTDFQQYMAAKVRIVRELPDDRLLSHLVHADVDGRRLEMGELMSILLALVVAGNETTTATLAAGVKFLIDRPELVGQLRAEPARMRAFVEETLRIMAPVQTMFRRAVAAVEIGGVHIPAEAIIEVRYGAANRDPAVYPDPAQLDLDRANSASHLTFGIGPHVCIGNQLARGELRLGLAAIVNRLDDIRLSRGSEGIAYGAAYITYAITKLWIGFDKR